MSRTTLERIFSNRPAQERAVNDAKQTAQKSFREAQQILKRLHSRIEKTGTPAPKQ
jgi:hypothetical protein